MRLLIVEDEPKIAQSIKRGLVQEGFEADTIGNGLDAYDMALADNYDVLILDLMLPKLSGLELCKKLREDKVETPILILTAKNSLDDKVTGLNLGADDYLTKPFAFDELLARIKALLRRPANSFEPEVTCGDITLDPNTFSAKRNGQDVPLTKREYTLLEYLIRNKNKVLSKDQIINHVWDYDSDILPNTVEQFIGYLRKKLSETKESSTKILTVRGFGYKIAENQQK
jgi:DNA-binding response OmpR family regulator